MPCACNGGGEKKQEQMYEVRLPSGQTKTLNQHDARVAITMAGGGEMRPVRA